MVISSSFQTNRILGIQRRGAEFALIQLANHFGSSLPLKLPKLWDALVGPLQQIKDNAFGKPMHIFSVVMMMVMILVMLMVVAVVMVMTVVMILVMLIVIVMVVI